MNPTNTNAPVALVRQTSAREFLAVLFRRKWVILGLFLVTSATVATVAFTTPTFFQSSGRVLVRRGERQSVLRADRQIFSDWEQELGSEMEVMKSVPVVKRARELLLAQSRREKRTLPFDPASIDVEVMGKSNVIAIGYVDLDPVVAKAACAAVMDAYIEYRSKVGLSTDRPARFFESEIANLNAEIQALLDRRQALAEQTGVSQPQAEANNLSQQLGVLEQRRSEMAADLASAVAAEQVMSRLQKDPDLDLPAFDGYTTFTNEQALIQLKERVVEQQTRIAQLTETLRDDAQEVVAARQTLETLQGLLRKEVEQRVRLAGARVSSLQARVAVLDAQVKDVRQRLDVAPAAISSIGDIDYRLDALRLRLREVTDSRDQTLITANTANDLNVVVLAPADDAKPSNTLDVIRLLLAPAFSLIVGVAIAFFIDGLDMTVRTATQAEDFLDLPVLASVAERRRRAS